MLRLFAVFVGATLLSIGLVLVARATQKRHGLVGTKDVEMAYITATSTLYGIFIAFMIFTVWTRYYEARENITAEANTVAEIYRMAGGLPDRQKAEIQGLILKYANSVINDEWRTMLDGKASPRTDAIVQKMWETYDRMPREVSDTVLRDHLLFSWTQLADRRRMRLLYASSGLSEYAYVVLFAGATITIFLASIFTVDDFWTHVVKASALAGMIALMMATVWGLGHPFKGNVRLQPVAFTEVINMLK